VSNAEGTVIRATGPPANAIAETAKKRRRGPHSDRYAGPGRVRKIPSRERLRRRGGELRSDCRRGQVRSPEAEGGAGPVL